MPHFINRTLLIPLAKLPLKLMKGMMVEFILAHSLRVEPMMAGKVQKEHEVADHIASTVKKWRAVHAGAQELH